MSMSIYTNKYTYITRHEHIYVYTSREYSEHARYLHTRYITHILESVDSVGLLLIIMNYNCIYYINV